MTLAKPALSTENALDLIVGELTIEEAARVTGRKQHYLRAIAHPTKRERLTVEDAQALDRAYAERHPGHYPIFESYRLALELAEQPMLRDAIELGRHAAKCLRESSEGCIAFVEASLPGADDRTIETAIREIEQSRGAEAEGIGALQEVLRRRRARSGPAP